MSKGTLSSLNQAVLFFQLIRHRFDSVENYQQFQKFQGRLLIDFLKFQQIELDQQRVLDLGCGKGGYSLVISTETAADVIGIDLHPPAPKGSRVSFVTSDALQIPLENQSVDVVICASLIEHTAVPLSLLQEIRRVLKDDGRVYLSFPPFYSPRGGHQFSPFHWFGEKFAIQLFKTRNKSEAASKITSYANIAGDWGLYVLTIKKVRALFQMAGFGLLSQSTRWLPINFSKIPLLGEILTWHVQFILKKTPSSPPVEGLGKK